MGNDSQGDDETRFNCDFQPRSNTASRIGVHGFPCGWALHAVCARFEGRGGAAGYSLAVTRPRG